MEFCWAGRLTNKNIHFFCSVFSLFSVVTFANEPCQSTSQVEGWVLSSSSVILRIPLHCSSGYCFCAGSIGTALATQPRNAWPRRAQSTATAQKGESEVMSLFNRLSWFPHLKAFFHQVRSLLCVYTVNRGRGHPQHDLHTESWLPQHPLRHNSRNLWGQEMFSRWIHFLTTACFAQ